MEKLTLRITRPDLTSYENTYTNVIIRKDETGIYIQVNDCKRFIAGFYPLTWAIEVIKVEILE
jgi:hypothetical protein